MASRLNHPAAFCRASLSHRKRTLHGIAESKTVRSTSAETEARSSADMDGNLVVKVAACAAPERGDLCAAHVARRSSTHGRVGVSTQPRQQSSSCQLADEIARVEVQAFVRDTAIHDADGARPLDDECPTGPGDFASGRLQRPVMGAPVNEFEQHIIVSFGGSAKLDRRIRGRREKTLDKGPDRIPSFERSHRRNPVGPDIVEAHDGIDSVIIPGSHVGTQHLKCAHGSKLSSHLGEAEQPRLPESA